MAMKKVLYILIMCCAFAKGAQAQSLDGLLNSLFGSSSQQPQVVEKPVYPTHRQLIGTWVYSQPEIVYEGDDTLAALAISSIKGQIPALLQRYGIVAGREYAVVKSQKITGVSGDKQAKATYSYTASNGHAIITGEHNGKKITVTGYLTIKNGYITILFDAKDLIEIASQSKTFRESSTLQMAANVISGYSGIKIGATAYKL
jgi:hypothetical protein